MLKNLAIMILIALLFFVTGCNIKTPEIRGMVLDAQTKQPVENAWVTATLGIKTKTVAGDTYSYLAVDPPHTRTDKSGRFIIPSKKFNKPFFPAGFGTTVESFGVGANTVDDRSASVSLLRFLGKGKADVTIYLKPEERTESEYFSHLQALYNYCLTGRFFAEVPSVEGGCDAWELDYTINKYKRYLEKYRDDEESGYYNALSELAYLYNEKNDYEKAIEILTEQIVFIERHGLLKFKSWQKNRAEVENKITRLQQKLKEKEK
jgi:tetratricopeptide (TPR) repeat protein